MAHKARRRPSWKKMRSKHFLTKWERNWDRLQKRMGEDYARKLRYEIYETLDKILQEEIDKEFIAELRKVHNANNGA
jgi:hypothetical protein